MKNTSSRKKTQKISEKNTHPISVCASLFSLPSLKFVYLNWNFKSSKGRFYLQEVEKLHFGGKAI